MFKLSEEKQEKLNEIVEKTAERFTLNTGKEINYSYAGGCPCGGNCAGSCTKTCTTNMAPKCTLLT